MIWCQVFPLVPDIPPSLSAQFLASTETKARPHRRRVVGYCSGMSILIYSYLPCRQVEC